MQYFEIIDRQISCFQYHENILNYLTNNMICKNKNNLIRQMYSANPPSKRKRTKKMSVLS